MMGWREHTEEKREKEREEGRRENAEIAGVKELTFLPKLDSFVGT